MIQNQCLVVRVLELAAQRLRFVIHYYYIFFMDNLNVQIFSQPEKVRKYFNPKIIFLILGVIVIIELVYFLRSLMMPVSTPPPLSKTSVVSNVAKISLNVSKASFRVGETIPVAAVVDTGGKSISGVDLIIHFDPKVLEITQGAITRGKIMDEYPMISVDTKNGLISISGIDNLKNSFKGIGQLALMNFRAKTVGKTDLVIDFKKGATTVSNITEDKTSKNILERVDNLEVEIK